MIKALYKYTPPSVKRAYKLIKYSTKHIKQTAIISDTPTKQSKERFLLFAYVEQVNKINTIAETVDELIKHSKYSIDWVNMYPSLTLSKDFMFHHYDGIIIHNSTNYFIEGFLGIDRVCKQKITDFKGLKIMFKQDEHYRHYLFIDYLERNPFNLIITGRPPDMVNDFYPADRIPNTSFLQALTSYVNKTQRELPYKDIRNRKIDVGYRGTIQPLIAGRLSYEKRQIGWEFEKYASKRNIVMDISSESDRRIFGDKWYDFLGNCKSVLSVESGASIADIDGSIEREYNNYIKLNPKAGDEEILNFLSRFESGPHARVIAPRHFQAAACFAVQVMYEDDFQGIFKKHEHYIVLNRDFSNVDEVIDKVLDDNERERITNNIYKDIIMNDIYSYGFFAERFDNAVSKLLSGTVKRTIFE